MQKGGRRWTWRFGQHQAFRVKGRWTFSCLPLARDLCLLTRQISLASGGFSGCLVATPLFVKVVCGSVPFRPLFVSWCRPFAFAGFLSLYIIVEHLILLFIVVFPALLYIFLVRVIKPIKSSQVSRFFAIFALVGQYLPILLDKTVQAQSSCMGSIDGQQSSSHATDFRLDLGRGSDWTTQGHLSFCSLATPV